VDWRERREDRFRRWLSPPGLAFASDGARDLYRARVGRIIAAIALEALPDRVPVFPNYQFLPAYVQGANALEAMTDQDRALELWAAFGDRFGFDAFNYFGIRCPIPLMGALGYGLYQWPGSPGVPSDHGYRYVHRDWLDPGEYREVADDPTDFWLRRYIPRVCGSLSGLGEVGRLTSFAELPSLAASLSAFGRPAVREAMGNLLEAGRIALEWSERADRFIAARAALGQPAFAGGFSKAPFDLLTDTFRAKKSSFLDVVRHPETLMEAIEALTPLALRLAVEAIDQDPCPLVFMPLHTGDDTFLSPEQFDRFYWGPLKKVIEGIVEAGGVPLPFAEGVYTTRLEHFLDLPRASACLMIDRTDMAVAKRVVGHHLCLAGNIPTFLFLIDDDREIRRYCRKLIDEVAPGGGFMIASGGVLDRANRGAVEAMLGTALEHGRY
jgi:uroporphyrinogen-III decarboxylase